MASPLSLLKLPFLPNKPPLCSSSRIQLQQPIISNPIIKIHNNNNEEEEDKLKSKTNFTDTIHNLKPVSLALPFLLDTQDALAVNGEFGLLEGRTLALVHPVVMGGLFFFTLWSGYLGWQWRRVRTIQNEIAELKKLVKPSLVTPDGKTVREPAALSSVEIKIQQLTEERKELLKGSFRDRHFNAGSILLGFGVLESVGGGLNTWFRTGKLFPGPHLYAGAGITVLWALAAALVPAMQKGNETARNLHIALNTVNVLFFVWQIPTGLEIVLKVFEFTTWP